MVRPHVLRYVWPLLAFLALFQGRSPRDFASDAPQASSPQRVRKRTRKERTLVDPGGPAESEIGGTAAFDELLRNQNESQVLLWLSRADSESYQLAMERCPPGLAAKVYGQMCRQQVADTNATALTHALRACAQLGGWRRLRTLVRKMEEQGCWHNLDAVESALKAANTTGHVTIAARILDQMASNRLAVKEKHYSWAIEAAARRKPPSPGAATYFMQELMQQAQVKKTQMDDLLSAHRDSPLSLTMHTMRNLLILANQSRTFAPTEGRKGKNRQITAEAAEVMLASLLGQMPHEMNVSQFEKLPRQQRTATLSLVKDFNKVRVSVPKRSRWVLRLSTNGPNGPKAGSDAA
ncbi:unnamed protein product [Cladocopium goreaui]|uniref:Uncharacterized protein n=1 Tax=Cladocopium goreaui TaxID=2562237 RepID=A0A9P1C7P7_9DINO|nr:unnamed protein product [Cladocopium goreaui]